MKLSIKTGAALVGVFAAAVAAPAYAQTGTVKQIQVSGTTIASLLAPKGTAGASFGSPLAFGASWGNAGVGLFGQTLDGARHDADGGAGFVVGFGDAQKAVGLEASMAFSSLFGSQGSNGGFGDNGSFGLKLHTALPYGAAFAVGVSSIGRFGDDNDAERSSVYAVGTKVFALPVGSGSKDLVLNLGVGDNAYQKPTKDGVGVFGSAAFYFTRQVSVVADYTGRFLNAGVSAAPFAQYPLTLTVGAINLAEKYGGKTELGASVGYGFKF